MPNPPRLLFTFSCFLNTPIAARPTTKHLAERCVFLTKCPPIRDFDLVSVKFRAAGGEKQVRGHSPKAVDSATEGADKVLCAPASDCGIDSSPWTGQGRVRSYSHRGEGRNLYPSCSLPSC